MRRSVTAAFVLLALWFSAAGADSPAPEDVFDHLVRRGIDAAIRQQYDRAFAIFDSLIARHPEDPRPYFYKAAALQSQMMDLEEYRREPQFLALIGETIRRADRWIKAHPNDAAGYFFKGGAFSYRGFYFAQRKRYLRGIRDAVLGIRYLNRAVRTDSTYYDAFLGIGTYKYWRTRLTEFLSWLPFFPDQKEEGVKMIRLAARKGRYSRDVARNGLIWIYLDRKQYRRAIALGEEMVAKYPGSRFFLWPLAEAYFRAGRYWEAAERYDQLRRSYRAEPENNHYNETLCALRVAESLLYLHQTEKACRLAKQTLALPLRKEIRKRLRKKWAELEKIARLCEDTPPAGSSRRKPIPPQQNKAGRASPPGVQSASKNSGPENSDIRRLVNKAARALCPIDA